MWVLLGTSLPKVNIMSIFCDMMTKNERHQRAVQRKVNIQATLKAGMTERRNGRITESRNGGK